LKFIELALGYRWTASVICFNFIDTLDTRRILPLDAPTISLRFIQYLLAKKQLYRCLLITPYIKKGPEILSADPFH